MFYDHAAFLHSSEPYTILTLIKKKKKRKLNPIDYAKQTFIPAMFIHGKQDNFIKKHHTENLAKVYPGDYVRVLILNQILENLNWSSSHPDSSDHHPRRWRS